MNLSKKPKLKKPSRTEPTLQVSEFNLVKSSTGSKGDVQLKDLTKSLIKTNKHVHLGQLVEAVEQNSKTLSKPLEKPQADRIRRTIAYEEATKQLDRWDAIVTSNRAAGTLRFPLNHDDLKMDINETPENLFNWGKTNLQLALEKVAPLPELETIVVNTDDQEFPLTMEEMMEKRKETAKLRAVQSYREAKARRQGKIKSKKFHRIERKAKAKQQFKEFEDLQKVNPEAALEKLEELERARAQERVSLRHKSTGQWAKNKQIRAKYDKESRQALAEQLTISRDLTQKIKKAANDSESDEDDSKQVDSSIQLDVDNPWTGNAKIKPNQEVSKFVTNYKSFSNDQNKLESSENILNEKELRKALNEVFIPLDDEKTTKKGATSLNADQTNESKKKKLKTSNNNLRNPKHSQINSKSTDCQLLSPQKKLLQKNDPSCNLSSLGKRKKSVKPILNNVDSSTDCDEEPKRKIRKTIMLDHHVEECPGSTWIVSTVTDELTPSKDCVEDTVDNIFDDLDKKLKDKIQRKVDTLKKTKNKVDRKSVAKGVVQSKLKTKKKSNFQMLELRNEKIRTTKDDGLHEGDDVDDEEQLADFKRLEGILEKAQTAKKSEEIDPNKFINMKPVKLNTVLPDELVNAGDENDASEDEESVRKNQKDVISEAFCDDDIVNDFHRDKQNAIDKNTPKDIDLTMPGWGSWGGKNLKVPKWKRRRFILKAPKPEVRKDSNRGNVIINEDVTNVKAAKHMVSDVPFPYKDVKEFEISLKTPIDATFIPQTAFRKFIEPPVITKMGTIIEPMTEDILLQKKKSFRK